MEYEIQLKNITKRFSNVIAIDGINLSIKKQEIHCILGENGSGKSTLMNVLFGIHKPDEGEIYIKNKKVNIYSPKAAYDLGIGMVHQHFMLFNQNTVLENIMIGKEETPLFLRPEKHYHALQKLIDQYDFKLNLDDKISELSVGEKQRVEILKVLYSGADIIIFDEPTAVLTPQESEQLLEIILNLQKNGKTIIFISHKFNETLSIGSQISVLRKGKLICTVERSEMDASKLAVAMVGKSISTNLERDLWKPGKEVLRLVDVEIKPNKKRCNIVVHENEILGIAGVDGNGQLELEQLITGISKVSSGKIIFCGQDITNIPVIERKMAGFAHIPSDRYRYAMMPDASLESNYLLGNHERKQFNLKGFLQRKRLEQLSNDISEKYDVKTPNNKTAIANLSGGNQQKVILGRELSQSPKLIIAVQPTRGLDIGAIEFVHRNLLKKRDEGCAILLISAEISEINELSDRIAVLFEGELLADGPVETFDQEKLGLLMAGRNTEEQKESLDGGIGENETAKNA